MTKTAEIVAMEDTVSASELVEMLERALQLHDIRRLSFDTKEGKKNLDRLVRTQTEIDLLRGRLYEIKESLWVRLPLGEITLDNGMNIIVRDEINKTVKVELRFKDRLRIAFGGSMDFVYKVYTEGVVGGWKSNDAFKTTKFDFKSIKFKFKRSK